MGGRVLALDLGARRVGVAVSDATATLATPLTTLAAGDRARVAELVAEEGAALVLVGLPRNMDGTHGEAARAAEAEASELAATLDVPVVLVDERLTTVSADRALREVGRGAPRPGRVARQRGPGAADRRRVVDQVAAAVLLQAWLDGVDGRRWRSGDRTR